jgi:hypothetical protein
MKGPKPAASGSNDDAADAVDNSGSLGRDVQDVIGRQLRAMYDNLVKQGVPDRFADLLQQLDAQEKPKTEGQE